MHSASLFNFLGQRASTQGYERPTTKIRRGIPQRHAIQFINDYVDDNSSGENDVDESGSEEEEEEEEAKKAQETAKLLAISTVGVMKVKSRGQKEKSGRNVREDTHDDEMNDEEEKGDVGISKQRYQGKSEINNDNSSDDNDEDEGNEDSEANAAEDIQVDATKEQGENGDAGMMAPQSSGPTNENYDRTGDINDKGTNDDGDNGSGKEVSSDEVGDVNEGINDSEVEPENEEFVDTRSKVPRPRLVLYNGTNDFDENPLSRKDSLGLSAIGDIEDAHVNGPSAFYTMEAHPIKGDAVQTRSEMEDPDALTGSEVSATEVRSLWNDAEEVENKLAKIPYPIGDSHTRLKLFVNEDGMKKGEPNNKSGPMEKVSIEHKKLISDLMQNVNGGKTIGEKFASKSVSHNLNGKTSVDGIPVIRSMTTRKLSTSSPLSSGKIKGDEKNAGGKAKKIEGNVTNKGQSKGQQTHESNPHEDTERETFKKLKLSVQKHKNQPIKNKTWEAEVNTLFPGKANENAILQLSKGKEGLDRSDPKPEIPSKKHAVIQRKEPMNGVPRESGSKEPHVTEKRRPTVKETPTDHLQVSTKRQCLGISVSDCIGPDSVTFNLPVNGPGEMGVQVNNAKGTEIIYPPGTGYNYQNGFQPENPYPTDMRQFPVAYPSPINANIQQQYGAMQTLNGYDNQPHYFPGGFPDHYPNNLPNMPQSAPVVEKKKPTAPTMKPSENSIFKGSGRKKKKKIKRKTTTPKPKKTTPKPKKTTTKCPNCGKSKKLKAEGGKKIPFTDKLWKLKTRLTTTTKRPRISTKTTPIITER